MSGDSCRLRLGDGGSPWLRGRSINRDPALCQKQNDSPARVCPPSDIRYKALTVTTATCVSDVCVYLDVSANASTVDTTSGVNSLEVSGISSSSVGNASFSSLSSPRVRRCAACEVRELSSSSARSIGKQDVSRSPKRRSRSSSLGRARPTTRETSVWGGLGSDAKERVDVSDGCNCKSVRARHGSSLASVYVPRTFLQPLSLEAMSDSERAPKGRLSARRPAACIARQPSLTAPASASSSVAKSGVVVDDKRLSDRSSHTARTDSVSLGQIGAHVGNAQRRPFTAEVNALGIVSARRPLMPLKPFVPCPPRHSTSSTEFSVYDPKELHDGWSLMGENAKNAQRRVGAENVTIWSPASSLFREVRPPLAVARPLAIPVSSQPCIGATSQHLTVNGAGPRDMGHLNCLLRQYGAPLQATKS